MFFENGHFVSTVCSLLQVFPKTEFRHLPPPCFLTVFLKIFIFIFKLLKNLLHAEAVCSLFKKWANRRDGMAPFIFIIKRDAHSCTVCTLFQKWAKGFCVRPLFYKLIKRSLTLARFAHFWKNEYSVQEWHSFLRAHKKGVSRRGVLLTFPKVCKRYHSGDPFLW